MLISLKQKKVKFKPMIKLSDNINIIKPLIITLYEVIGLFRGSNLPVRISMSDFEKDRKEKSAQLLCFFKMNSCVYTWCSFTFIPHNI